MTEVKDHQDLHYRLTESSAISLFVFGASSGQLVYGNPALFELVGKDKDAIKIDQLEEQIHQDDREDVLTALRSLTEGGSNAHLQFRLIVGKQVKWLRVTASLDRATGQIYGQAIDLTAETESLETYQKYANKKNAVLNILAHDLRGPLSVAGMLTTSLKTPERTVAELELVESILKINQQAIDLIKQLVDREFLDTATATLAKKRIDLTKKVKEYIAEYQLSAPDLKRTFSFSSKPDTILLEVDESKLIQVLNNLSSNALKFTRENGNISFYMEDQGDSVLFRVQDDGIGIPAEHQAGLFDKFTNASRKGLQGEPSMGLGMYVIKNIIEWHGGNVWVESAEEQGTSVFFSLPRNSHSE